MSEITLKVKKRPTGKQEVKRLRKKGLVPGVFYIKDQDAVPIITDTLSLRPIVYTAHTRIIKLEIEGESQPYNCVLKDISFHPVTDNIVHFDLMGIIGKKRVTVEVPIILLGQAIGIRTGGLVQHSLHKVPVKCLPQFMPDHIEVDITDLKMGDSINLKSIKIENVEFMIPGDTVICSIVQPRVSEKPSAEAAAKAAAVDVEQKEIKVEVEQKETKVEPEKKGKKKSRGK